jgi:membrane protease YdiL (CAAX protease family)
MVLGKRILIRFLICTFLFTYLSWGTIIVANRFGVFEYDTPFGIILYICGTWAPTIFAYICLKQNKIIRTTKDFIKVNFTLKEKPKYYLLAFMFLVILYLPSIILCKSNTNIAWYLWFPIFPLMIIDGGMEEIGWRYLLQPTLEKRFPFFIATTITAFIWWAWHIPMFFIPGSGQSEMSFMLFALFVFGQSFSLASIFQVSKNVWLCIMYHALINTLSMYWPIADNLTATLVSSIGAVVLSMVVIGVHKRNIVNPL